MPIMFMKTNNIIEKMGDCFCNLCDKTIKLKHKEKHLNTKSHMDLSESIFTKYCVKIPELIEIEKKTQKHVNSYSKRFEFYQTICKWKIKFVDTIIHVKSKRTYSNGSRCGLIRYLLRNIDYFKRQGLIFSRILEMNITFITSLGLLTYEYLNNQPMQMIERVFNEKLY